MYLASDQNRPDKRFRGPRVSHPLVPPRARSCGRPASAN